MKSIYFLKFTIILTSIALVVNACNKKDELKTGAVWGNVADDYTGKALEGVKVYIFNSKYSTSRRYSTDLIDSTLTNKEGGYYKKFSYDKGEAFQIDIEHPGYYWNEDVAITGINQEHHSLIRLRPNINFKIRIQNKTPILNTDSFYWFDFTSENGNYYPIAAQWFVGNVDTTLFIPIAYNDSRWYFQYQFKDSLGIWNINSIRPYCAPLDTVQINLTF